MALMRLTRPWMGVVDPWLLNAIQGLTTRLNLDGNPLHTQLAAAYNQGVKSVIEFLKVLTPFFCASREEQRM